MTMLSKSSFSAALLFITRRSAAAHSLRDTNAESFNVACLGNYFIGTSNAIKNLEKCSGEFIIDQKTPPACKDAYWAASNEAVTELKSCIVWDQDAALDSDQGVVCLADFYLKASNAIKHLETCEYDNDTELPIIIEPVQNLPKAGTCRRTFSRSILAANRELMNCNGGGAIKADTSCRHAYYNGVDQAIDQLNQSSDNLPYYFINVSNEVKALEKCEGNFFLPVPFEDQVPKRCNGNGEDCKADCGVGSTCKDNYCRVNQGEVCKN